MVSLKALSAQWKGVDLDFYYYSTSLIRIKESMRRVWWVELMVALMVVVRVGQKVVR